MIVTDANRLSLAVYARDPLSFFQVGTETQMTVKFVELCHRRKKCDAKSYTDRLNWVRRQKRTISLLI